MSIWFRKGVDPGDVITLDLPVPSQWEVVEKLNEYDFQLTKTEYSSDDDLSYAITKLLCCDPKDHKKLAFIRIYLQVPYCGTEIDDAATRASQAMSLVPEELIAYQELTARNLGFTPKLLGFKTITQDKSGPVPGGYAVWLAWEKVPGVRLGSMNGPDAFWDLDATEREEIRQTFLKNLRAIHEIGYSPDTPALSSLVWNKETKTLYFIGFHLRNTCEPKYRGLDVEWMADFGLTIPNSRAWLKPGWNQDTSGWRW